MSKQEEAGLILKLYELRREERCGKPGTGISVSSIQNRSRTSVRRCENSGYVRMVITYWDMAAALVNNGAISLELFNDSNKEHIGVFAKIEPILGEIRNAYAPQFAANLEKSIDATPGWTEARCHGTRADKVDSSSTRATTGEDHATELTQGGRRYASSYTTFAISAWGARFSRLSLSLKKPPRSASTRR